MDSNTRQSGTRGTLHAPLQGVNSRPGWELLLVPQMDRQAIAQ